VTLRPLNEALAAAVVVTVGVTAASAWLPARWIATAVGGVFLGATWLLVLRHDDAAVERAGLGFGGLVLAQDIDLRRVARAAAVAMAWCALFGLVFFGPFYGGFRAYARWVWHAHASPVQAAHLSGIASEVLGQIGLVALPEEAFYRGYLQTRLDDAWPRRVRVLGAEVGPSILVTSAIFAAGHFLTIHDPGRLAVFFPSLLFGWLRARTGGVGASIAFHASCNTFSALLYQAYGAH
jgi:hypothetical protein